MAENTGSASVNTIASRDNFKNARTAITKYGTSCKSCLTEIDTAVTGLLNGGVNAKFAGDAAIGYKEFYNKVKAVLETVDSAKEKSLLAGLTNYLDSIEKVLFDNTDTPLGDENKKVAGVQAPAGSTDATVSDN